MFARIVIISGSPGTGKSSITKLLTENSTYENAVHIHTDDFYQYICKGYIPPWLKESNKQNETVTETIAAASKSFASGGYEVFVDGVVGPWFIKPWGKLTEEGIDVRYIVLRPDEQTTIMRAATREKNKIVPLSPETVRNMWHSLSDLGKYESHAIDTTAQTVEESVMLIRKMLSGDAFRI